jgi:hypothetical protein
MALAASNAFESSVTTLALKADMLPAKLSFDEWSKEELNLNITAFDAVRIAAARSKVLVIVDQLDALASIVDLTSHRLNDVMEFIRQCALLPRVSVLCSCRKFDFRYDARFGLLKAETIDLELPPWEDVVVQLERHGIKDNVVLPEPFRELLRTPQHLHVYLKRFSITGKSDPFGSYYLMLDELCDRTIQNSEEQNVVDLLTDHLVTNEAVWAPYVCFEEHKLVISRLESRGILQN